MLDRGERASGHWRESSNAMGQLPNSSYEKLLEEVHN